MNQIDSNAYLLGAIIGGLIAGIIIGFVPLITAIMKKRVSFGVTGFVCCVIGGGILGLILAIPIAAVFTLIIILRKTEDNFQLPPEPPRFENTVVEFNDYKRGETK